MFAMEPQPYWEPAEDCYIIHYTKTVVTAFGDDEGWDAELGLKTEIVPLAKPYGLYAGNIFQGVVKLDGEPVPYAEVEVEYYNQDQSATAPTDYMVTQTVKADQNGVFSYAAPKAGWWGFAALNTADYTLKADGQDKDVELGAVIWVRFEEWQGR
jgi:cobalt/nickel transport protein